MPRSFGHIYLYSFHVGHPPQQDNQVAERTYYLRLRVNTKNDSIFIILLRLHLHTSPYDLLLSRTAVE